MISKNPIAESDSKWIIARHRRCLVIMKVLNNYKNYYNSSNEKRMDELIILKKLKMGIKPIFSFFV
ncbi:MAG: hypothetical protein UHN47_18790 [Lachnospiraceae bacterium]|nr:hypothetical protein [Lachnospiraceae bacterium]